MTNKKWLNPALLVLALFTFASCAAADDELVVAAAPVSIWVSGEQDYTESASGLHIFATQDFWSYSIKVTNWSGAIYDVTARGEGYCRPAPIGGSPYWETPVVTKRLWPDGRFLELSIHCSFGFASGVDPRFTVTTSFRGLPDPPFERPTRPIISG